MTLDVRPRLRPRFPLGPPTWPGSVPRPPAPRRTGVDYDTAWARGLAPRLARAVLVDDLLRPLVHLLASPKITGLDRLADLDEPAIFAANHHSHVDTPLLLTSLPDRWRHRAVVAAAADYFFTTRRRGALSALTLGAIPMERLTVSRRSAYLAAGLLDEGWSLIIFPEGGRTPDGWARDFRGGAAFLALRSRRPVVPVHLEGTGRVHRKGTRWPRTVGSPLRSGSGVHVTFGRPLRPEAGEDVRRFAHRVEAAVAALADEQATDWWSARRRAAAGDSPVLTGPAVAPWRRAWALEDRARRDTGPTWP